MSEPTVPGFSGEGYEGEPQRRRDQRQSNQGGKKKHTARNVLLGFLAVFLVVAVVAGVFVFNLAHSFDSKTHKIDQAFPDATSRPSKPAGEAANAQNILLLGSDSRGDSPDIAEGGGSSNQRSDTMMLIHIPADRKHIYTMSILRDTWVDIPGHGQAKINAAMAYGGVPLTVQTLEGLFGTRIDHVAIVDFDGFKSITDALGGVTVNVPVPFTQKGHDFPKGAQTLNGTDALTFVRERHAFPDGDYQRVKDQQIFLRAVVSKLLSKGTLANPVTVNNVVNDFSPFVSVDSELNAQSMAGLALSLNGISSSDLASFTLPTKGTGTSADGQSIVNADPEAIAAVGQALQNDQLQKYLEDSGLTK